MRLKRRVEDLESRTLGGFKRWHQITQKEYQGETEEQAVAKYEAANGPIGDDECLFVRIVI